MSGDSLWVEMPTWLEVERFAKNKKYYFALKIVKTSSRLWGLMTYKSETRFFFENEASYRLVRDEGKRMGREAGAHVYVRERMTPNIELDSSLE